MSVQIKSVECVNEEWRVVSVKMKFNNLTSLDIFTLVLGHMCTGHFTVSKTVGTLVVLT